MSEEEKQSLKKYISTTRKKIFGTFKIETISNLLVCFEEQQKEIERLNKQLQLISDEFLKYDWENSSKEQIINQLKSLYNSIFKGSDKE